MRDSGYVEQDDGSNRAELVGVERLVGDDQVLVLQGEGFAAGDRVRAVVPWSVRFPTMANHTATHLLHEALRRVLGDHVKQAGSAVRPDKLRFDFTHDRALTEEERTEVERIVNEQIFANHPVRIFETPIDEARKLGAQMLFGEKYGDIVRVVEIDGFSRELCGGTHVRSTAEIGPFVILSEGSVGSGARRIEAVTVRRGVRAPARAGARGRRAARPSWQALARRRRSRRRKAEADFTVTRETAAGGVNVLVVDVKSGDPLDVSDRLKQQHAPAAVIVGARDDGTAQLLINLDKSLEARGVNAGDVIREAAALIGGKGGGRPTMARAGGKDRRAPARGRRARREDDHRGARLMKVLALDYGAARTGVAVSDATGTLARPLDGRRAGGERAGAARARRRSSRPRAPSGSSSACRSRSRAITARRPTRRRRFVEALRGVVDVPVESFDERFTTALAAAGPSSRAAEDARAAAHLLESYLTWTSGNA